LLLSRTVDSSSKMNGPFSAFAYASAPARTMRTIRHFTGDRAHYNERHPHAPPERERRCTADPPQDSGVLVHRLDLRFLRSPASELHRRLDVARQGSRAVAR